jgi:hypothetical protein
MRVILVFLLSQSFAEGFERPAKFARDSSDSEEQDDRVLLVHGSCHDFQLFKQSRSIIAECICILADAGYQGLASLHSNSQTSAKKSKLHPLSAEQKIAKTLWLAFQFDCGHLQLGTQSHTMTFARSPMGFGCRLE